MTDQEGRKSSIKDIYSVNFADYLPDTLKRDTKMKALAAAVTEQLLGISGNIKNVLIYSRMDELPEELIDILAYDMHVDWYDYSYPADIKRSILKNSVKVHKKLGTKYAVETALRNVYKDVNIAEWFEYGGRPYYFKINLDASRYGLQGNAYEDIINKTWFYKNLRSHCDGIYVRLNGEAATAGAVAGARMGGMLKVKGRKTERLESAHKVHTMNTAAIGGMLKVKPKAAGCICVQEKDILQVRIAEGNSIRIKART